MRHITVHDHATGVSTLWSDWGAWRASRTAPRPAPVAAVAAVLRLVAPAPIPLRAKDGTAPCGSCLGARAILERGPLGLVPVVCDACCGTGRLLGGCAEGDACEACAA